MRAAQVIASGRNLCDRLKNRPHQTFGLVRGAITALTEAVVSSTSKRAIDERAVVMRRRDDVLRGTLFDRRAHSALGSHGRGSAVGWQPAPAVNVTCDDRARVAEACRDRRRACNRDEAATSVDGWACIDRFGGIKGSRCVAAHTRPVRTTTAETTVSVRPALRSTRACNAHARGTICVAQTRQFSSATTAAFTTVARRTVGVGSAAVGALTIDARKPKETLTAARFVGESTRTKALFVEQAHRAQWAVTRRCAFRSTRPKSTDERLIALTGASAFRSQSERLVGASEKKQREDEPPHGRQITGVVGMEVLTGSGPKPSAAAASVNPKQYGSPAAIPHPYW